MNKIASVKTINGKATVTVDTEQSHEVIDVENGACLVLVKGEDSDDPHPEPQPEPTPDGGKHYTMNELLIEINGILQRHGFNPISEDDTPFVYDYLLRFWRKAEDEWNNFESWIFSEKTYPDIYNWHGNNKDYQDEAYNSLHAWLLAMQLSELVPTSGISTNAQTDLFGFAYSCGGGRSIPLYGLQIHADPMISRFAAGAIYAINRSEYKFSYMDTMRNEIGGTIINASDWNGLGYQGESNVYGGMRTLGYLVNSDVIIPSAPAPFADGCDNGRVRPYEQGQPMEQFAEDGNYKVDKAIDDFVVQNYNQGAQTGVDTWNGYDRDTRQRIMEAVAAPRATNHFFFGKKLVKFDGIHDGTRAGNYTNYCYYWFSEASANGADVYEIAGPFADLYDKMFKGSGFGTPTPAMEYFDNIMTIADNSRFPTFEDQYGRRRPCGGTAGFSASARSPINGDPLNALYNIDVSCIFADNQSSIDKWAAEDGFVCEKPKSYPSGHAAMTWTVALMLGQMTGDEKKLKQYETAAYEVGVNRTVARYHWNSDVIYGRLFGTMVLPIVNAMNGLRDSYEDAKDIINGDDSQPTPIGSDVTINLLIKNNTPYDVTLSGEVNFVLANPDRNGEYHGWEGIYNRTGRRAFSSTPVVINAGKTTRFDKFFAGDIGGRSLLPADKMKLTSYASNALLYDTNGDSDKIPVQNMPSDFYFENGGTYTIIIG